MRLSDEQRKILRERDIIANEACDACGKVLGCVRFTRKGEVGEWCSRPCRDGQDAAAKMSERIERRSQRIGRPAKYATVRARRVAQKTQNADRQRRWRSRMAESNAKVPAAN